MNPFAASPLRFAFFIPLPPPGGQALPSLKEPPGAM